MMEPFDLENDAGDALHLCPASPGEIDIVIFDGTGRASYTANERDAVRLLVKLQSWVRGEADRL